MAPIRPSKIVCVGKNYAKHAAEMGGEVPAEPLIFLKPPSALVGDGDPIVMPSRSSRVDYEGEIGVIIGRRARHVGRDDAWSYVEALLPLNDVTARDLQKSDNQWSRAKGFDTFAPLGPWLVTPEAVGEVQNLAITSAVNGEPRQNSSTRHMIFGAANIVAYVSGFMTLEPGDVIYTGTPSGVGSAMTPPVFLKPGDRVTLSIEKLGSQTQTIAPAR